MNRLCNSNRDWPLRVECFDWDNDGTSELIGTFQTTLNELLKKKQFDLIEPKIQAKKGNKYTNSGILKVLEIQEFKIPRFNSSTN